MEPARYVSASRPPDTQEANLSTEPTQKRDELAGIYLAPSLERAFAGQFPSSEWPAMVCWRTRINPAVPEKGIRGAIFPDRERPFGPVS